MIIPSFYEIEEITDSRYALVMLVAKRARQIVDGAEPIVEEEEDEEENAVTLAIKEVLDGDITFGEPMSDYEYHLLQEKKRLMKEAEEAIEEDEED